MLSDAQLFLLKENNYGHKIIYVRFSDEEFVFKTLSVKDYELLLQLYDNKMELETAICNISVVYPEDYEFQECPYGYLPTVASKYILKYSDLTNKEDIQNLYYLEKINYNFFQNCMDLIKAFIPEYTYEEMEEWTWSRIIQAVSRAEKIAAFKGFEYHINFENVIINFDSNPIESDELNEEILNNGLNPIIYYKDSIEEQIKYDKIITNDPFIIGISWNNQEVLNGFRNKKAQKQRRKR